MDIKSNVIIISLIILIVFLFVILFNIKQESSKKDEEITKLNNQVKNQDIRLQALKSQVEQLQEAIKSGKSSKTQLNKFLDAVKAGFSLYTQISSMSKEEYQEPTEDEMYLYIGIYALQYNNQLFRMSEEDSMAIAVYGFKDLLLNHHGVELTEEQLKNMILERWMDGNQ